MIATLGSGVNVLKEGSRNPGFNNVLRLTSKWRAILTLIGDCGKGYAALAILARPADSMVILWCLGIGAILGHCYSPFLRFRGGKGVGTGAGVLARMYPLTILAAVAIYVGFRIFGRRMKWEQEGAIASLISTVAATLAIFSQDGIQSGAFAVLVAAVIFWRHRSNLRTVRSTEVPTA